MYGTGSYSYSKYGNNIGRTSSSTYGSGYGGTSNSLAKNTKERSSIAGGSSYLDNYKASYNRTEKHEE